ncbi:MAG: glycosyltransferase family 1 protein [Lachnospiraceae bacterium]|jgi:glycosyltransferase involved in cell wall biosynthesis|nr:glycosyltransferase family 1 protein [Lachnospiraceae bacterium]
MIKILVVAKDFQVHGISKVIMNYFHFLEDKDVEMDFAIGQPIDSGYRDSIKIAGRKIYVLPSKSDNPIEYYSGLYNAMKMKKYDIVHVHGNSASITIELVLGLLASIPVRIAHSHNSTCNHKIIHKMLKGMMRSLCTERFACSEIAGKWMFGGRSFQVIQNCFDTKSFMFDRKSRELYRDRLQVGDAYVIGHVGFFNQQKNQRFIIDIFNEYLKKNNNSRLLSIGDGENRETIEIYAKSLKINDKVIFLGVTNDVAGLLSAMDCFIFPSLYEGLGIALIEAQISGLPCLLSDVIPDETKIGKNYYKMSLQESACRWADKLVFIEQLSLNRETFYFENKKNIDKYDCSEVAEKLYDIYLKCIREIIE